MVGVEGEVQFCSPVVAEAEADGASAKGKCRGGLTRMHNVTIVEGNVSRGEIVLPALVARAVCLQLFRHRHRYPLPQRIRHSLTLVKAKLSLDVKLP